MTSHRQYMGVGHSLAVGFLVLTSCSPTYTSVVPDRFLEQIDPNLTFSTLKENPTAYTGKSLLVGGEVLSAKRLKDHTRLMVLQLPLLDTREPTADRTRSQGRFIAIQPEFLDPATVPPGTRITMVGEVTGASTEPLDEMEYTYPTLQIIHLHIWPSLSDFPHGYWMYRYPYYPYGYIPPRYWGRFSPFPYRYWW